MKAQFDLVIVGAGPAGLAAARAAAASGMTIAIVDDNPRAGGQVWRQGPSAATPAALRDTLSDLTSRRHVTLYSGARVIAVPGPREMIVESSAGEGLSIVFERLIIAAGARERLLPFEGWTLPGVTGAGGLQALIKGGMPVRGERVVLAGSGPLLVAALATARAAGAEVVAVVEQAPWGALLQFGVSLALTPSKAWQAVRLTRGFAGTHFLADSVVKQALGNGRVEAAVILSRTREVTIACDRIACGFGLVPNVALAQMMRCVTAQGGIEVDAAQSTSVPGVWAAGECTGIGGMELASAEGAIAGFAASGQPVPANVIRERDRWRRFARRVERLFELGARARAWPHAHTILCRCEDVAFGDVSAHKTWRDAKLHTRCSMGPCQGRVCGAALQIYLGWDVASPRPPLVPARIGALIDAQPDDDARL